VGRCLIIEFFKNLTPSENIYAKECAEKECWDVILVCPENAKSEKER
jgi:hypothetical protein